MGIVRGEVLDANLINLFVKFVSKGACFRVTLSQKKTALCREKEFHSSWLASRITKHLVLFLNRVCDVLVSYANNLDI